MPSTARRDESGREAMLKVLSSGRFRNFPTKLLRIGSENDGWQRFKPLSRSLAIHLIIIFGLTLREPLGSPSSAGLCRPCAANAGHFCCGRPSTILDARCGQEYLQKCRCA